jgi:hypothetical protein
LPIVHVREKQSNEEVLDWKDNKGCEKHETIELSAFKIWI